MQAGRRFPGPNPPLRGGLGLLGDAPPGYGPPRGVPPSGIPPPGVPPPPLPRGTSNIQQSGFPRAPPPGVPPPGMAQAGGQQSHASGLTSPTPGSVPPRIGLLGPLPNLSQPPPQTHYTGSQQQQNQQQQHQQTLFQQQNQQIALQQQQQGNNNPLSSIPGADNALSDLQSGDPQSALALVNQLLQRGGLGAAAASGTVNITSPTGLNNAPGATASVTPDLTIPPPSLGNNTSQITNMHNSQTAQQLQQLQTSFAGINNAMNAITSIGNMLPQQQYNGSGTTGGNGFSGTASSLGGPVGSTSVSTSPGLTIPGAMQGNGPYNSSTITNSFDTSNLQNPSLQVSLSGTNTTTTPKQPLLPLPPGVNTSIPPPNLSHTANRGPLLPNPNMGATNMYQQDMQHAAVQQQQPINNNGNNNFMNGVSRVSFVTNIYFFICSLSLLQIVQCLIFFLSCMFHCLKHQVKNQFCCRMMPILITI